MKLTIARSIKLFGAAVIIGFIGAMGMMLYAMETLKINGPLYQRIVDGKDLIADILPPPMFVVESYLLASEASDDKSLVADHTKRIGELEAEYRKRIAYWDQSGLADEFKVYIKNDLIPASEAYWKALRENFLPDLATSETAQAKAHLREIRTLYLAQKASVERLVSMANTALAASEADGRETASTYEMLAYGLCGGVILAMIIGTWISNRRTVVPITSLSAYMTRLASGDFSQSVPYVGRGDEIGEMASAVNVFRTAGLEKLQLEVANRRQSEMTDQERNLRLEEQDRQAVALQKVVTDLGAGLERLSQCNIRMTLDEPFEGGFEVLRQDFNTSLAVFQQALVLVLDKASEINGSCKDMQTSSDQLSKRTEQQAAALEQTAAALEEISVNVKNSAERANHTKERAKDVRQNVVESSQVVQQAISAMERIEHASSQIGTITDVIDQIAFQTNLLALNAGVEAARAGDAGKGFAVVAQEVRELAQRSAHAAKEISSLIGKSNTEVAGGVDLVRRTGSALGTIETYINEITDDIEAMANATAEQSTGLSEVTMAVNQMDQITQQNAAMVEEAAAATHALADNAELLAELVSRFQLNRRQKTRDAWDEKMRTQQLRLTNQNRSAA